MRVAVLGAGMTGLVAAHRLAEAGQDVDVYERWPGLGGQVATLDLGDGHLVERYYHHLFTSDHHIAALYEELGMGDSVERHPSTVAMFSEGRSWPFTTPMDLLRFGPVRLRTRLRMGLAVVLLQRRYKEVEPLEGLTAAEWIRRSMGAEAWEKVWGPLLRGKFGDRAEDISMAWLWARFKVRRQIKGAEARQEVLVYPRGGWQPLLDRLRDEIESRGGRVLIDRPAVCVGAGQDARLRLTWGGPDSFRRGHDPRRFEAAGEDEYDAVLATVPNDVFEELLDESLVPNLAPGYLERMRSIEYHAALCMLLELDRPFSPYYWINIADRELPFVGLVEQTNLVSPDRYGRRRLLYVANYLARDHELLSLEPEELLDRYEPGLRSVNPAFRRDWVRQLWVFREPAAQPIVTVGYRDRIPPLETGVPGLLLANTTQVYPEDRGTNYSVRLGEQAAKRLLARPLPNR